MASRFVSLVRLCTVSVLLAPALAYAAMLGNPGGNQSYSGIGVISGWHCSPNGDLTVRFNDGDPVPLVYGTRRPDVLKAGACSHDRVGFVAIWNWATLGEGTHTAVAYDNGVEFARTTLFTVGTLGEEFVRGANKQVRVEAFPSSRESTLLRWNQYTQHFEIVPEEKSVEPEAPKEAIVFSDLIWSSVQVQNRIAQYIVEEGYGYPTDVKFGTTLPLFQGLRRGDTHVTMEIWLPNQNEMWNEARAEGAVLSVGQSLGKDWQSAFVIPKYLQEQYPELDSVEDLKEQQYKDLFKTAETGDKARLVSCIIGWACEEVNAAQVEGYGLSDHVEIVNPGHGAALNADLYGAYERKEPWLGYQWGTNDPALILDLVRLEEPAYSDECWATNKACAYEDATVLIAVHSSLPDRAGDVVEMLRAWDFRIDRVYREVAAWQHDNPEASVNATALWWLGAKADLWTNWVTAAAADAIQAALADNEIPDGWPEE